VTAPTEPAELADGALAYRLADQAGALLRRLRDETGFANPAALRASGDKLSHELLTAELSRWRPDDAVLSEEGIHDGADRTWASRVWIVDPLDGTREFGEPGRSDWAVHVALWAAGSPAPSKLAAAAVALPAQHRVLSTDAPPRRPAPPGDRRLRMAVSRSRAPEFLTEVARRLGADLVPMGSAGAKICAVVSGDVDAYLHAGGQYEWDSAAPVAVARAAGLFAARLDGSPLSYNRKDPWLPDLVVCRAELVDRLTSALGGLG
jgi:3'(2'), 5'-bisphosphate nucleotidase